MKLRRRKFLHLTATAVTLRLASRYAWAQAYPTRPVRIIVGYAAAGPTDIAARLVGQWLSERLGQSFVVDNRPGAASNISTELVVRALPDGYTLLQVGTTNAINAILYDNLNFNFIRGRTRKSPRAKNGGPTCWMIRVLAQAVTPRRIDDDVQCGKRETRRARR
jgi:hypothetical protein